MNLKTFGHDHVKKVLEIQLLRRIFSHAYLFYGPEGLGKKMLAKEFAEGVLKTQNLESHPDYVFFDVTPEIGIEELRGFMERLSYKPFLGQFKVAIVNNAQNFNTQSQNALLKTLEEPSASTVLILISSEKLLPTILSRCQVMNFNRFSLRQMQQFLEKNLIQESEQKLRQAFGLPGKIFNPEENLNKISDWQQLKVVLPGEKLAKITEWAELESDDLIKTFEQLACYEILELEKKPSNFKIVSLLLEAKENLKRNLNKKLVLQKLFTCI